MSILVRYTAMTLAVMLGATCAYANHHMPEEATQNVFTIERRDESSCLTRTYRRTN